MEYVPMSPCACPNSQSQPVEGPRVQSQSYRARLHMRFKTRCSHVARARTEITFRLIVVALTLNSYFSIQCGNALLLARLLLVSLAYRMHELRGR